MFHVVFQAQENKKDYNATSKERQGTATQV